MDSKRTAYTNEINFDSVKADYLRVIFKSGGVLKNGIECFKETPGDLKQADIAIDEIEVY